VVYLETNWASLIPFDKVVALLKEVLPVAEATNSQTVREHSHAVAERIEQELGEERQPRDFATVEAIGAPLAGRSHDGGYRRRLPASGPQARDAGEPAGGLYVRRRRRRATGAGISASEQ
jgi:hypothetical protein